MDTKLSRCGAMPEGCGHGPSQYNTICACIKKILCFLAIIFALDLGFILGAVFAPVILGNIGILISIAVIVAIIILATLIFKYCLCRKQRS